MTTDTAAAVAVLGSDSIDADTLDRIAGDAALEFLIDRVMALPVAEHRSIATIVSLSPEAELSIRRDLAEHYLLTQGRSSPDGRFHTLSAWITVERLNLHLRRVLSEHFPNVDAGQVAIAASPADIVRATGHVPLSHRPVIHTPGWRHVTVERKELAEQSCRLDAVNRVRTTIGRLRLSPQQTVGDLLREHPTFDEDVRDKVKGLLPSEMVYDPGGLCILTFRLARAEVIRLLAGAAHESQLPVRVDFSKAHDSPMQTEWLIQAYGALPPLQDTPVSEPARARLPEGWPAGELHAAARAEGPSHIEPVTQRLAWAERLARVEAERRLWLQLEALPWKQKTVGHFLAAHPEGQRAVEALEALILETPSPSPRESDVPSDRASESSATDGTAEARLRISLPMVAETLRAFDNGKDAARSGSAP